MEVEKIRRTLQLLRAVQGTDAFFVSVLERIQQIPDLLEKKGLTLTSSEVRQFVVTREDFSLRYGIYEDIYDLSLRDLLQLADKFDDTTGDSNTRL